MVALDGKGIYITGQEETEMGIRRRPAGGGRGMPPGARPDRGKGSRAPVAGLWALLLSGSLCGCGGRTAADTAGSLSLVGTEFTEDRLANALDSLNDLTIDFTARPDLGGILFGNMRYHLSDPGPLVEPTD